MENKTVNSLKGKNALITGSSRGIGKAMALRLASLGANIVVNCPAADPIPEDVLKEIVSLGVRAIAVQGDVSKKEDVKRIFDEAEKTLGKLDIVVANAGVFRGGAFTESKEEDFDWLFGINTKGTYFTLQEAAKRINDGGRIIATSTAGTTMFVPHCALYLASKAAIEQLVRTLAHEIGGRKITVNTLSPGYTATGMLGSAKELEEQGAPASPFKRLGSPDDIADVLGFLASEEARWLTGQNIQAGGGVAS